MEAGDQLPLDAPEGGDLSVLASINANTNLYVATLTVGLANGDVRTLDRL